MSKQCFGSVTNVKYEGTGCHLELPFDRPWVISFHKMMDGDLVIDMADFEGSKLATANNRHLSKTLLLLFCQPRVPYYTF